MGDFPYLDHLSLKYLDISRTKGHWTDYIKAHGLLNACLARDPTREDVKERIYDLERHWYNGSHPKTYPEHRQRIADHKSQLSKLRDKTKHELDILEPMHTSLSTDELFSGESIIQLLTFSNEVFKMSGNCTANVVDFSGSIILSSMELLAKPPCPFAVFGLGSISRGEATPYSDLEYGFLVESDFSKHKYFTDLAVESYFCIGNLGESPLKCFTIEELNVKDEKGERLFIDQPPVNGFKIDGISPKAGNIPTGHGREGGKRLILTVNELMSQYRTSLMAPADPGVPGDMSDLLFSPVLIHGHNGGEILLGEFMAERSVFESAVASTNSHSMNKRLNTIITDIRHHRFVPEFSFSRERGLKVEVKSDIFRFITLLAHNLKIASNLDTNYPWETFQWFQDNNALSPGNSAYLKIVLGLSIFIRTKAYLALGSQYDLLSLQPTVEFAADISLDRYYVPQNIFLPLGCLLKPVKRSIESSITKVRSTYVEITGFNMSRILSSVLGEFQIVDDFLIKAEVLNFMLNFRSALSVMEKAVGESCVNDIDKFQRAVLREYPYPNPPSAPVMRKALELMGSLLHDMDRREAALEFFSCFSFKSGSEPERISWDMLCVQILTRLGEFKKADSLLRKINNSLRNILWVDISVSLHTYVISLLKRPKPDISLCQLILSVYKLSSEAHHGLDMYQQALDDLTCAMEILNALAGIGEDTGLDMVSFYNSKGQIYHSMGDTALSVEMYEKSITVCKSMFGLYANSDDIATLHHNVADLYTDIGKFDQASSLAQQAIDCRESVFGHCHHLTMRSFYLLGVIYLHRGMYLDALNSFKQILSTCRTTNNISDADVIVKHTHHAIGAMFYSLGEYTSAHNFLSAVDREVSSLGLLVMTTYDTKLYAQYLPSVIRSLSDSKTLHGTNTKIRMMLFLGNVCLNISTVSDDALGYFAAALSLGSKTRLFIYHQALLLNISKSWKFLEQYRTAVQFSTIILRSDGETPDRHTGEAHYIIGDCYMRLGLNKKSWSHLHSALCLYQNLPKYRSFVLILAKIHLSISLLLIKLCRLSESSDHVEKAVKFTADLISDQEKTSRECMDINEQATMLQDTLVLVKEWGVFFSMSSSVYDQL